MTVRKALKTLGWTVGLLLAALVMLYLVLLAINWNDRPVGAAAATLDQIFRDRKPLADGDNAFVFLAGMEKARAPVHARKPNPIFDPSTGACRQVDRTCQKELAENDAAIRAWHASDQWLTEQYATLLGYSAWRDTGPGDNTFQSATFLAALDGQRLLLLSAAWRAAAGDTSGAKDLLEKDIRFWRMVLAAPNDLITKMVATAALRRHFQWVSMTLSQLPKERQSPLIPQQWRIPVSLEERSLRHTFAAEMAYFGNATKHEANQQPSGIGEDGEPDEFVRLLQLGGWHLSRPLWKRQDAANRHAAMLLAIADELDVDYGAFHADRLSRARAIGRKAGETAFDRWSYNPLGNVAIYIAAPSTDFTIYAIRVADLEGVRRTAVLAAQLRSEGIAPGQVSSRLAASTLRDPYTGAPFAWDAKARALVFTGLEPIPRGRHPILY